MLSEKKKNKDSATNVDLQHGFMLCERMSSNFM